jgi:hypothetical protein
VAAWLPPAPDHWVRRLLGLLLAEALLEPMPRTPALAGGRVPQLEHLKAAACRTTCLVKHQKP